MRNCDLVMTVKDRLYDTDSGGVVYVRADTLMIVLSIKRLARSFCITFLSGDRIVKNYVYAKDDVLDTACCQLDLKKIS